MPTSCSPRCLGACPTTTAQLQTFVHRGSAHARTLIRADALLKLDADWSDAVLCDAFAVGASPIWQLHQRYAGGGL